MAVAAKILGAIGIRGGIAIVLAGLALWFWIAWGSAASDRDKAEASLAIADAELVLLRADAELKETAGEERQADTAATAAAEKEMIDAIREIPDEKPDAVRVRLGCERLRRAGYLDADLPLVCRSGGGGEARPSP